MPDLELRPTTMASGLARAAADKAPLTRSETLGTVR